MPDAWLINFTNPSGMVTEAVIKHFGWKKCIGLCNVPTIAMMAEPKLLEGYQPVKLQICRKLTIFIGIKYLMKMEMI